ncbi:MAG: acetate kinase [Candidatus Aminicenantes bacterium]|nr:acetate kinase [Candidatus Aminicenantes bacterium]
MKILVINTGSSSIKYQLFDMEKQKAVVNGLAEKIGEKTSILTHKLIDNQGNGKKKIEEGRLANHAEGLERIVELLVDPEFGAIRDKSEISAVGHRVVHGGEAFQESIIINEKVLAAVKKNIPLAPLHNPPNLTGIEVAQNIFPDVPHVGVFDTSFHQTIPRRAYLYAVPYSLYEKQRVRRYGFHGTSHAYVAEEAAAYLKRPIEELKLITIHLGNGASMAAVKNGRCIDTSMGLTPLEGLVMGTRCGDVDPALPYFMARNLNMTIDEIDKTLNKQSGLKGLCGDNDMRNVEEKAVSGDELSALALEIYSYRIKKYIGAYYASLGHLDAIIFTAGIGENSPLIRGMCCEGLDSLGISVDACKNKEPRKDIREISPPNSQIKVLVIPTNEEKKIAMETERIVKRNGCGQTGRK